eukprot:GFYU01004200.1.p1 GENE.GFYU01004200.1~~GFYU01004200.1.p1  ORF type:complete len:653 (+),score=233.34 GFYU01004200.1:98-1960(+)
MARVYYTQGQYDDALRLYERALDIAEKTLGHDHPQSATILNNLSLIYDHKQDKEAAKRYATRALSITKTALGDGHADVASMLNNTALLKEKEQDYTTAFDLYREASQIFRNTLGPTHSNVATAMNNMARVMEKQGRVDDALRLYQDTLTLRESSLGSTHPHVATTLHSIASLLMQKWSGVSGGGGGGGGKDDGGGVKKVAPKKSLEQQLEKYQVGIRQPVGARAKSEGNKEQYIVRELFADLGLKNGWRTWEFWGMVILLIVCIWGRVYIHYFGQWLLLASLNVPITELVPGVFWVDLIYPQAILPLSYEIGQVEAGVTVNEFVLLFLVIICGTSEKVLGCFIDNGCRFIAAFGIAAILDPVFILIVDCIRQNWARGDAFKLYNYFLDQEGSGVAGIFLVFFIYVGHVLISGTIFYVYMLNFHMNGRMLDVYNRLNAPNEYFITPSDLEMSARELKEIAWKAEKWRGAKGERRKTTVTEFVMTDLEDPTFREVTTHMAIYTLGVEGSRTLYRHFLRLPDGTIVEVFGDLGSLSMPFEVSEQNDDVESFFKPKNRGQSAAPGAGGSGPTPLTEASKQSFNIGSTEGSGSAVNGGVLKFMKANSGMKPTNPFTKMRSRSAMT